jgi:CRP/FNR family transcriptional regulator
MKRQLPPRSGFPFSRSILCELPQEYASRLLKTASSVSSPRRQVLFQEGAPADGCYWLERGVLKISVASPSGKEHILAILGPGSIVGEFAMIDEAPRSATVEAVMDCELTFVSRSAFKTCLQEHPELYGHLALILVARLRQADEEAAAASFLTPKARIARALLQFSEHLGREIGHDRIEVVHAIRQSDLASMAGVARESVSRALSDWKRRDIVGKRSSNRYVIHRKTLEGEAIGRLR